MIPSLEELRAILAKKTFWSSILLGLFVALKEHGLEIPDWLMAAVIGLLGLSVSHAAVKSEKKR